MEECMTKISNLIADFKFETVNGNKQLRLIYEEFIDTKIQDFILLYLKNRDVEVEICGVSVHGKINSIKYIDGNYTEHSIRFEVVITIDYELTDICEGYING